MLRFREYRPVERNFDTNGFDPDKRINVTKTTTSTSSSTNTKFDPDERIDVTKTTTSSSGEYNPDDRVILF